MHVLTAILLFVFGTLAAATNHITTPFGNRVPVDLVRAALPTHLRSTDRLHDHLFEISHSSGAIQGPSGFHLPLNQLTETRTVGTHPNLRVTLNGEAYKSHTDPNSRVRILSGNGFSLVLQGREARPLAVWGNRLNLRPVHTILHPNILVHVPQDHSENDIIGDVVHAANSTFLTASIVDRQVTGMCLASNPNVVEIAVAFDTSFCNIFSGFSAAAIGAIQAIHDEANIPYRRDTCLELALVHLEANCGASTTDPYDFIRVGALALAAPARSDFIFEQFRTFYSANKGTVARDTAFFFFGFDEGTGVAGVAATPGTCNNMGYGWVEGTNPYVFAHEVGHNLNAQHVATGIMMAEIVDSQLFFSDASANTMKVFVENGAVVTFNIASTCLERNAPSCDSTCPNACLNNKCVAPIAPGTGFASCKLSSQVVYCATMIDRFGATNVFYQQTECPTGTQFVDVPFNISDPEILCCQGGAGTTALTALQSETNLITFTFNSVPFQNTISVGGSDPRDLSTITTSTFYSTLSTTCGSTVPSPTPSTSTIVSPTPSSSVPMVSTTPSSSVPLVSATPSSTASLVSATPSSSAPLVSATPSSSAPLVSPTPSSSVPLVPSSTPSSSISLGVTPSATASITSSASVSGTSIPTNSVTSSPSSLVSVTSSPSASLILSPTPSTSQVPAATVCSESYSISGRHALCRLLTRRSIRIRRAGRYQLWVRSRSGSFFYIVRALNRRRLEEVNVSFATNTEDPIVTDSNTFGRRRIAFRRLYSVPIANMRIPSDRSTCCGSNVIRARITVRLCRRGTFCRTGTTNISLRIPCGICRRGNVIPMDVFKRCPSCV